jgi:hypothetical protein
LHRPNGIAAASLPACQPATPGPSKLASLESSSDPDKTWQWICNDYAPAGMPTTIKVATNEYFLDATGTVTGKSYGWYAIAPGQCVEMPTMEKLYDRDWYGEPVHVATRRYTHYVVDVSHRMEWTGYSTSAYLGGCVKVTRHDFGPIRFAAANVFDFEGIWESFVPRCDDGQPKAAFVLQNGMSFRANAGNGRTLMTPADDLEPVPQRGDEGGGGGGADSSRPSTSGANASLESLRNHAKREYETEQSEMAAEQQRKDECEGQLASLEAIKALDLDAIDPAAIRAFKACADEAEELAASVEQQQAALKAQFEGARSAIAKLVPPAEEGLRHATPPIIAPFDGVIQALGFDEYHLAAADQLDAIVRFFRGKRAESAAYFARDEYLVGVIAMAQSLMRIGEELTNERDSVRKLAYIKAVDGEITDIATGSKFDDFDENGFKHTLRELPSDFVEVWLALKESDEREAIALQTAINLWHMRDVPESYAAARRDLLAHVVWFAGTVRAYDQTNPKIKEQVARALDGFAAAASGLAPLTVNLVVANPAQKARVDAELILVTLDLIALGFEPLPQ